MGIIENIKAKLDEYVENGGVVENLSSSDPEYRYVKDARIIIDGKKLNTEEKFELAGHPRVRKISASVEQDLIKGIEDYRNAGGDFNVDYKDLPFIDSARKVIRTHKERTGENLTVEECLRKYGAEEVSHIYKRYRRVMDLKDYKDNEGFVDSYRKDSEFYNYISKVSESLDMLDAVVVGLIGNQDLQKCYIDVDYLKYVKKQLEDRVERFEYTEGFTDLQNLSKEDKQLYHKLKYVSNKLMTEDGYKIGNNDVVEFFGIDSENTKFRDVKEIDERIFENEFQRSMEIVKHLADENKGKLSRRDIPERVYKTILVKSNRLGVYLKDLFKTYDIEYIGGINKERFTKMQVNKIPYIKGMRKYRDELYAKYLADNPNNSKQINFENYLKICVDVYDKYKERILGKGLIEVQNYNDVQL